MIPQRFAPILQEMQPLASRFREAGHRLYLVGGTVRDLLMATDGEASPVEMDFDATTTARPEEIKKIVGPIADAVWTQGEKFGTIGLRIGARQYEITTHRAESYHSDSRKPEVAYSDNVEEDLSRRDFTVNAMALEITSDSPELVDPFGGAVDLITKVLRTPLSPEISFSDDPLRMMRAARFIAKLQLVPVPELVAAVKTMTDRMSIVSAERIRDELDKLMTLDKPSSGLWFLVDTGLADQFLP